MPITLKRLLPLPHQASSYKLHLACWNGRDQPLDVFVRSRDEWTGWNRWRGRRDDFSREFIFSLIEFYPEPNAWLFGGIFRVTARGAKRYKVVPDSDSEPFVGRLKAVLKRPGRAKAFRLENYYDQIVVSEILKDCYTGEVFCGYERIDQGFRELEAI